jgi:Tfp pilus assembly protein PilN
MKAEHFRMEFISQEKSAPVFSLIAAAVAALVFGWVALQLTSLLSERAEQQQALKDIQGKRRAPKMVTQAVEKPDPKDVARALLARQTVRSLNTPWADLLDGLEKAPNNVALLVVEPSASKRSLSITAEAANPTQMLDYMAAMQGNGRFTNVALVSHQLQAQAPGSPLRFQLRANWGDAP